MGWISNNCVPLIADVHGNAEGLRNVLHEISKLNLDTAPIFLGDLFWTDSATRDPLEVLRIVRSLERSIFIKGNTEQFLLDQSTSGSNGHIRNNCVMNLFKESLTIDDWDFIANFKNDYSFEFADKKIVAIHASPKNLNEGLNLDHTKNIWKELVGKTDREILISGHLHRAFTHMVDGLMHVCVGAVGRHTDEYDGVSEYALLDSTHAGLVVVHQRVNNEDVRAQPEFKGKQI